MLSMKPTLKADDLLNLMNIPEGTAMRENLKRTFRLLRDRRGKPLQEVTYIDTFPTTPQELKAGYPDVFEEAYPSFREEDPSTGPVPSQVNCMILDEIRKALPCRITHSLAQMAGASLGRSSRSNANGNDPSMMRALSGFAAQNMFQARHDDLLPNLQVFDTQTRPSMAPCAQRQALPALQDERRQQLSAIATPQRPSFTLAPAGQIVSNRIGWSGIQPPPEESTLQLRADVNAKAQDLLDTLKKAKQKRGEDSTTL